MFLETNCVDTETYVPNGKQFFSFSFQAEKASYLRNKKSEFPRGNFIFVKRET